MFPSGLKIIDLFIGLSTFGVVLSIWLIGLLLWYRRRSTRAHRVEERLGISEADWQTGQRIVRLWDDDVEGADSGEARKSSLLQRFRTTSQDSKTKKGTPLRTLLIGAFGAPLLIFILVVLTTGSVLTGAGAAASVILGFWIYLKQRASARATLFESQFIEALDLATRSLRAGHPLAGSFRLIADEIPEPVGLVFEEICQQQELGVGLAEAIQNVAAETDSPDMKLFAPSVIVPLRSGGSLADMMERLAFVVRDRMKLNRRIRVLAAQTQFSKRVLLLLPFLMYVLLNIVNPEYMEPLLTTTMGNVMMAGGAVSLLLGNWVMNRMADIKY